ncbi:hypothetical protein F53441_4762 [Fusarium austroafricanum]|uniref:chitinase n=1 Tax=Fusarium austroafricanum TaxID=2364996 RepID=A0A8H4P1F1_9HYPO|nr:hypothetical protein F53441_4762 [Fusarium austroafricanum]
MTDITFPSTVGASGHVQAYGGLNGYWGQDGSDSLKAYCDSGPEYVTLSFVNQAPENTVSGFPGTNFAGHCGAGVFKNKQEVDSSLLKECYTIKESIPYCQERGVKVLLSIGGVYKEAGSNYKVSTDDKGVDFADFLYNAFGPYNKNWNGPRPFDSEDGSTRPAVDGFDFDIEHDLPNGPYIAMINELRRLNEKIIITGAPQCPTSDKYFYMKDMINQAKFDALFIQFYNNPSCDAIPDPSVSWDRFNYDDWEAIIEHSEHSQGAKLYVGLPASEAAAPAGGYLEPKAMKDVVCALKDKAHFAGISLWDLTRGAMSEVDGKSYNEHVMDALKYGCGLVPVTTTTEATSTAVSTTTADTTITDVSSTDATTTSDFSTTDSDASSTGASSIKDVTTTGAMTISTTTASNTLSTEDATASSSFTASGSSSATDSSTVAATDSTASKTSATATDFSVDTTQASSTDSAMSIGGSSTTTDGSAATSTAPAWTTSRSLESNTVTDIAKTTETAKRTEPATTKTTFSTLRGWNTTSTGAHAYTQAYGDPVTATVTKGSPIYTNYQGNTETIGMTTSTVCTTRVHTEGGYVVTETIPLYTTVCPVTAKAKPTHYSIPSQYETKTIYTTSVHTVAKCLPGAVDCSYGSVTTDTIPVYITVCPVTEDGNTVPTNVPDNDEIKTLYTAQAHTVTQCPPDAPDCRIGAITIEVASWTTATVLAKETQPVKAYKPAAGMAKPLTKGAHFNATVYTSVVVPPATLKTATKPGAFEESKPTYKQPAAEQTSGAAAPTGGYKPAPASVPTYAPAPITPTTAGASSLTVGLAAVAGIVLFHVLAL